MDYGASKANSNILIKNLKITIKNYNINTGPKNSIYTKLSNASNGCIS